MNCLTINDSSEDEKVKKVKKNKGKSSFINDTSSDEEWKDNDFEYIPKIKQSCKKKSVKIDKITPSKKIVYIQDNKNTKKKLSK